ncbi:PKD domain-containing protein [Halorubrum depositum]|uniref:PKD domain-containing protein n=1 Tax=Halorubrum depositum TaxID=2583992 RepID=UPI0011A8F485|nr:PKD domain-containing protein [Halorubrum depositum]
MNVKHALGLAAVAIAVVALVASGAAVGGVAGQDGPPATPAAYYGQVTLTDGGDPIDGVTVEAVVDGEVRDSIETDADGSFGGSGAFDEKLTVEGPVDGDVTFRVADADAGTAAWESGANEEVALELDEAPAPDDGSDSSDDDPGDGSGSTGDGAPGGGGSGGAPGGDGGVDTPDAPGDTDAPDDEPTDEPSVEVPEGATAVAGETATVEAGPDGTSSVAFAGETGVEGIEFDGAVEGDVSVTELDAAPESTGQPPGAGVSTVEISVPEAARNSPATIRTRIGADRLEAAGADAEDLRLSRHSEGEWQALETSVVERDGDDVVLAAETPGFSVFAVSAVSQPEAAITVDAGESGEAAPGETVTLSGVGSSDEYGEIVAYDWDVDGETAAGSVTETTFSESGEYDVELMVTNDAGETDSTTATVTVESAGASGPAGASPVEELGLFSPRTLGAVVGALVLALLVVATVRRADR